jgi:hypothetical protein
VTRVNLSAGVALITVQAVDEQLQLMRVRAIIDRRWRTEVARLEAAYDALTVAIESALRSSP